MDHEKALSAASAVARMTVHQTKQLTPRQQAELELADENFRKQVDAEKARLRERRSKPFWQRLIPWKIVRRP